MVAGGSCGPQLRIAKSANADSAVSTISRASGFAKGSRDFSRQAANDHVVAVQTNEFVLAPFCEYSPCPDRLEHGDVAFRSIFASNSHAGTRQHAVGMLAPTHLRYRFGLPRRSEATGERTAAPSPAILIAGEAEAIA